MFDIYNFKSIARKLFVLIVVLTPSQLLAEPDAGTLLREEITVKPQPLDLLEEKRIVPSVTEPKRPSSPGLKVQVDKFKFIGDIESITETDLDRINYVAKAFSNRKLNIQQMIYVAALASNKLRNHGYSFATIVVPKQNIGSGIIKLQVFVGKLQDKHMASSISIHGAAKPRVYNKITMGILQNALHRNKDYLSMKDVERAALLLNDLAGINGSLRFEPGDQLGTTKVIAEIKDAKTFNSTFMLDNYGNRFTGTQMANATLNINSPTKLGDLATLEATVAKGLRIGGAKYTMPLGSSGLNSTIEYLYMNYRLGLQFVGTKTKGEARYLNLDLKYPLLRSRENNLYFSLGYMNKILIDLSNNAVSNNKRVNNVVATVHGNRTDDVGGMGITKYSFAITTGVLNLRRNGASLVADQINGPGLNGGYKKINLSLSRLQRVTDAYNFSVSLSGQVSNKNLDSSEQMSVGGNAGISAYPSGEGISSQAFLLKTEAAYLYPRNFRIGNLKLIAFYEAADLRINRKIWVNWNVQNPSIKNRYRLHGLGCGVSLSNSKNFNISARYAHKLGKNGGRDLSNNDADGSHKRSRILLQFTYTA